MEKIKKIILLVFSALFLEIIFSNYTYLKCITLPHDSIPKVKFEEEYVFIDEIEYEVKNILIKYKESTGDKVKYLVSINQYGQEALDIKYPEKWDVTKKSTRINTNCVTEVHNIKISGEYKKENIESIVLNSTEVKFNLGRFALILTLIVLIILGKQYVSINMSIKWRYILILATITNMFILGIAYARNPYIDVFMDSANAQDMNLVAEALAQRQLYFTEEPDEKLLRMENPYDYSLRVENGVSYLFDATYYNGKYYTYFGITPVLLLFLPFYLLTGKFLHTYVASIFFVVIFIYLLSVLYHLILKKNISEISVTHYILSYYTLIVGCGGLMLLRGEKYDVALASALVFVLLSIIMLYGLQNTRFEKQKLFIGGVSTGLIVLSKPNFIVYYIIIFYMLINYLKNKTWKEICSKIMFFIVPLGGCAIFQMLYNFYRFDHILEFGNQYQVGANIQMFNYFSILKILKGLFAYFFTLPRINIGEFPFITIQKGVEGIGMNTHSIVDVCVGLVACPIIWIILAKKHILSRKEVKNATNSQEDNKIINIMLIVAMLNLIISTVAASINEEYLVDVRIILIGVSLLLCHQYNVRKEKIWSNLIIILCISTITIMLPISLALGHKMALNSFSYMNIFLKNIFEFWS